MDREKENQIELNSIDIVVPIPRNTVQVDIEARIFIDGEVHSAIRTLDFQEVSEGFFNAESGYFPPEDEELPNYKTWFAVEIPDISISVTLKATVYENGEVKVLEYEYPPSELRKLIRDAEENYISPDAIFALTEKGRVLTEELGL